MFFVASRNKKNSLKVISNFHRSAAGVEIPLDTKNYFYLRNWAVSSYEDWGLNHNADGWRDKVLQSDYNSFDGAWVCLDHIAQKSSDSIGSVLSPVYTPEKYVETVMAVSREKADRKHPFLEKDIQEGRITDTSMGCVAQYSVCTVCGNKTANEDDYCDHLRPDKLGDSLKGSSLLIEGKKIIVGELYENVQFVEDSILTGEEGADINAKIFNIAAKRAGTRRAVGDDLFHAIKAVIKEQGRSDYLNGLLNNIEKLGGI